MTLFCPDGSASVYAVWFPKVSKGYVNDLRYREYA